MELTKAHKTYLAPGLDIFEKEIPGYGEQAKAFSDSFSHVARGNRVDEAFNKGHRNVATEIEKMREVDFGQFTGHDPYSKAVNYGHFIKNFYEKTGGGSPGERMQKAQQALQQAKEEQKLAGGTQGGEGERKAAERAEMSSEEIDALAALSHIHNLSTFQVGAGYKNIKSPGGRTRIQQLKSFDDVPNILPQQFADPMFKVNLIEQNVLVTTKIKKVKQKQTLFVLLDDSGSMSSSWKMAYVRAIMLYIKRGIVKGETTLYFSLFEQEWYGKLKITTVEEFDAFYNGGVFYPNGGGTDIASCVEKAARHISELRWGKKIAVEPFEMAPEIIIINDGQDYIDGEGPIKTHAITLGRGNEGLKQYCEASGGTYNLLKDPTR